MSTNVIINVMGTKEDVQKFFDVLCEPNEYGETGIRIDRNYKICTNNQNVHTRVTVVEFA